MYKKLLMIFIANSIAFASLNSMSEEKERLLLSESQVRQLRAENAPIVVERSEGQKEPLWSEDVLIINDTPFNYTLVDGSNERIIPRESACRLRIHLKDELILKIGNPIIEFTINMEFILRLLSIIIDNNGEMEVNAKSIDIGRPSDLYTRTYQIPNFPKNFERKRKHHDLNFNNKSDNNWHFSIRNRLFGGSLPGYVKKKEEYDGTYDLNHSSIGDIAYFEIYTANKDEKRIYSFLVEIAELRRNKVCEIVFTNDEENPIEFTFQNGVTQFSRPKVTAYEPTQKRTDTRPCLDYQ